MPDGLPRRAQQLHAVHLWMLMTLAIALEFDQRYESAGALLMVTIVLAALLVPQQRFYLRLILEMVVMSIIQELLVSITKQRWRFIAYGHLLFNFAVIAMTTECLFRMARWRARAEARVAAAEQRYRSLVERNLAGIFRLSADGNVLDCNPAFAGIFAAGDPSLLVGLSILDLTAGDSRLAVVQTGTLEREIRRLDGETAYVLQSVSWVESEQVYEGSLVEITDRKRRELVMQELASRDSLTGLYNRREFDAAMTRQYRSGRPVTLLLLDLDHFKRINDEHGHPAGDAVLKRTAEVLQSCCREGDLAARIGGEEFALVLPEADMAVGLLIAERLRQRVADARELPFPRVTVSVGVASRGKESGTPEELLASADRALYEAKHGGRNRVRSATPVQTQWLEQRAH